jgi:hypothetical protein
MTRDPRRLPPVAPTHPSPTGTAPFRRHAEELDLFAGCHTMRAARAGGIIALAAGLAAAINAEALATWAVDLPLALGPVRAALVSATGAWADAMAALGADRPYAWARELFRGFQDWRPGG